MPTKRRFLAGALAATAVAWLAVFVSTPTSHAAVAPGATIRASLSDHATTNPTGPISGDPGMQAGAQQQSLSADGRYEIFISYGDNWNGDPIAPGPGNQSGDATYDNVYVRDLETGQTSQVSIGDGLRNTVVPPDGNSAFPSVSADGRYVAFVTDASNIGGQAAGATAFVVCDRDTDGRRNSDGSYLFRQPPARGAYPGFFACVTLPAPAASATTSTSPPSLSFPGLDGWPRLAGGHDGLPLRVVWAVPAEDGDEIESVFAELGQNPLTPPDPANVVDLVSDTDTTRILQLVGDQNIGPNAPPFLSLYDPAISDDGRSIVVAVNFPAFVQGQVANNVILRITVTTAPPTKWRMLRADKKNGTGFVGNSDTVVQHPQVSNGGTRIVFDTTTTNPIGSSNTFNDAPQVYAVDATDPTALTAVNVSVDRDGQFSDGEFPALSADGRYISFVTDTPAMTDATTENSASFCSGNFCSTCITDVQSGGAAIAPVPQAARPSPTASTSRTSAGQQPGGGVVPNGLPTGSVPPAPGVPPRIPCQVVSRDLVVDGPALAAGNAPGPAQLASPSINLNCGSGQPVAVCDSNDEVQGPISVSASGAEVAYTSSASDLVNTSQDQTDGIPQYAYVHTWQPTLSNNGTTDLGEALVATHTQANIPVQVVGFGPLTLGGAIIGGPDATDFTVTASTCGSRTLAAGDTCDIAVDFHPTAIGTKTATLSVNSNQFSSPVQVATLVATAVPTGLTSAPADNTRTSLHSNGKQAPAGGNESMISGNGRWDVFVSSSNLAGINNNGRQQVFVRDLADPQHTVQISLHTAATANGNPSAPSRPIFVKGHPTGASPNDDSFSPSISSDGRFVSFITDATDIVPLKFLDGTPPSESFKWTVVVCDRDPSGAKDAAGNPILDLPQSGTQLPDYVCYPAESGSFALPSGAPGADLNSTPQLSGDGSHFTWVEDTSLPNGPVQQRAVVATVSTAGGALQPPTDPTQVPIAGVPEFNTSTNGPSPTDPQQTNPRLTRDGSAVVFNARVELRARPSVAAIIETNLADGSSVRFDTTDNGNSYLGNLGGFFDPPAMSDDGTRVAFAYRELNGNFSRVYVATESGTNIDTVVASVDNSGAPAAGNQPALSGDGRYLAFQTSQPNESNGVDPPNGGCFVNESSASVNCQIVARDLVKDAAQRAANLPLAPSEIVSSRGIDNDCPNPLPAGRKCGANNDSFNPSIDQTGSEIGFDSIASDIVPGDDNQDCSEGCFPATDAFVHTWRPTIATPSFDFGAVTLGTHKVKTFTVTEQALAGVDHIFGPISLGQTSITGVDAADFALLGTTCTGKTLNDGDSCSYKIRFTPAAASNRTSNLSTAVGKNGYPRISNGISYDPPPTLPVALTGVGTQVSVGQATVNPTTLDFGKRLPLAPRLTKTVTVTDTGTGSVSITAVAVQDTTHPGASGDYKVDATACLGVLQPGQSCVITVGFRGRAVGNRGAQLVITDDTSTPTTTVTLLATVPKPKVTANPGVTPPGRVTTISGTGFAPGKVVDVTLKGFGESATVKADKHGNFDVGLVIFRNTPEGPQTVLAQTHGVDKSISADGPLLLAVGSVDILQLVTRH